MMKVREVIAVLQQFDPEAQVIIEDSNDNEGVWMGCKIKRVTGNEYGYVGVIIEPHSYDHWFSFLPDDENEPS